MSNHELAIFLFATILLLLFSLVFGQLFNQIKLPRVVGEICGGFILGQSGIGYFFPEAFEIIFNGFPEEKKLLSIWYWFGLIFLMLTSGFHLPKTIEKKSLHLILMLIAGGTIPPLLFGFFGSSFLEKPASANPLAFSLVMGVACAVTSIPVISRIFSELNLSGSFFAQVVLVAAGIQDLVLWGLVTVALSAQNSGVSSHFQLIGIGEDLFKLVLLASLALFFAPIVLKFLGRRLISISSLESLTGYTLLACLVMVGGSLYFGVNVIFGALIAGVAIGRISAGSLEVVKDKIYTISNWFFIPIYFALTGLEVDLRLNFNILLIVGFILITSLIKIASVVGFLKLIKIKWNNSFDFGLVMNARGGPGIILASIAFAEKIIDGEIFITFILCSVITSLMAGSWLKYRIKYIY